MIHTAPFRFIALVVAAVLMVVVATPAKAEAVDALAIVAIAGLVVAGIIIVAYLVIANVEGSGSADGGRVVWVACAAEGCAPIPATTTTALVSAPSVLERQAP